VVSYDACLDDFANGTAAQWWTFSNNTLQINGKCLDVTARST
jgi:hypothetical protein